MKREASAPALVPPVADVIGRLPQFPASIVVAAALNLAFAQQATPSALTQLCGKVLRIVVRDLGLRFTLGCEQGVFRPRFSFMAADVTISANARDFARLALREEDPDTLFFARRLTIEGDTELGLMVKNALDALDTTRIAYWLERLRNPAGRPA